MTIHERIVQVALAYKDMREKQNNSGFIDPAFEAKMKAMGWLTGQSWCVYTCELIWKEAYGNHPGIIKELDKLFSGSATATWRNFQQSKTWKTGQVPMDGAIAIWRYGTGWQGHAAIDVKTIDKKTFETIEGNSNDDGAREGYEVAHRTGKIARVIGGPLKKKGLNFVGFIYPKEISL
jgi:hypothetical protein